MRLIHRLRCEFDEPYRIRIGFGLSPIRTDRELKALVKFCEHELKEPYMMLNHDKRKVLQATIDLAGDTAELPVKLSAYGRKHEYINVSEIISDYCGIYWS